LGTFNQELFIFIFYFFIFFCDCRQRLFIYLCHLPWYHFLYMLISTASFHFLFILQPFLLKWLVQNRLWQFWFVYCDVIWLMVEAGLLCLLFICTLCLKNIKMFDSQGFLLHTLLCDIKFFIACLKILA
jgi:hypothetical protein